MQINTQLTPAQQSVVKLFCGLAQQGNGTGYITVASIRMNDRYVSTATITALVKKGWLEAEHPVKFRHKLYGSNRVRLTSAGMTKIAELN